MAVSMGLAQQCRSISPQSLHDRKPSTTSSPSTPITSSTASECNSSPPAVTSNRRSLAAFKYFFSSRFRSSKQKLRKQSEDRDAQLLRKLEDTLTALGDVSKAKNKAVNERNTLIEHCACLQSQLMEQEDLTVAVRSAKSEVTRKHDLLKLSLIGSDRSLMNAETKIKGLTRQMDDLQTHNDEMQSKINSLQESLGQARVTLQSTNTKCNAITQDNSALRDTIEQLKSNISSSADRSRNMAKYEQQLKNKIKKIEKEHAIMGKKMTHVMEKSRDLCNEKAALQDRVAYLEYSMNNPADLASLDLTALAYLVTHGDWTFVDTLEQRYNHNAAVVQDFILQGRDHMCALTTQLTSLEQNYAALYQDYEALEQKNERMWSEGLVMWKQKQDQALALQKMTSRATRLEADLEKADEDLDAKKTELFHALFEKADYERALEAAVKHMQDNSRVDQGSPTVEDFIVPDLKTPTASEYGDASSNNESQDTDVQSQSSAGTSISSPGDDAEVAGLDVSAGIEPEELASRSPDLTISETFSPEPANEVKQGLKHRMVHFHKFLAMVRRISENRKRATTGEVHILIPRKKKSLPQSQLSRSADIFAEPAKNDVASSESIAQTAPTLKSSVTFPNPTSSTFTFGARGVENSKFSFILEGAAINPFTSCSQRRDDDSSSAVLSSRECGIKVDAQLLQVHGEQHAHPDVEILKSDTNKISDSEVNSQDSTASEAAVAPTKATGNNKHKKTKTTASRKSKMISNYYGADKKGKRRNRN